MVEKKGHGFFRGVENKNKIAFPSSLSSHSHIPLTHTIPMFTREKEIALNCTYRVLNRVPLTAKPHRTWTSSCHDFNSKYFSCGARGPRLFSVIVNYAKVYSCAMRGPVRFVKWLTQVVLIQRYSTTTTFTTMQ